MKKRMSRLLSALLVLAMLCAMVPAVLAEDVTVRTSGTNEVYVGDTFTLNSATTCVAGHTQTLTLTDTSGKTLPSGLSGCIEATTTDRQYKAAKTTFNTAASTSLITSDTVRATVKCAICNRSSTYSFKIYNHAKDIVVTGEDVSSTQDNEYFVSIIRGQSKTVTAKVVDDSNVAYACKQAITVTNDPSGGATATYTQNSNSLRITASKAGMSYITLNTPDGVSQRIIVEVVESSSAEIKDSDNKVLATSSTSGKMTAVKSSTQFQLTANLNPEVTGSTVTWTSSNQDVAPVTPEGKVTPRNLGTAKITATFKKDNKTLATAVLEITVIDGVSELKLYDTDNNEYKNNAQINLDRKGVLTVSAKATPDSSSKYVVWSVSSDAILDISSNSGYNATTKTVTGTSISVKAKSDESVDKIATLTATAGDKKVTLRVKIVANTTKVTVTEAYIGSYKYEIRDGENIAERFEKKYPTVRAKATEIVNAGTPTGIEIDLPVDWFRAVKSDDGKSVKVYGAFDLSDSKYADYTDSTNGLITVTATLTNEGEVTSNVITASKTSAVAGDKITFTAKAAAEPSDAKLAYQWYKNGTPISGATSASYTFTVPEASEDSTITYKFTCGVTATRNNTTSAVLESNTVTLNVARDYSIELTVDDSKAAYTVGETPKVTATVYKWNGSSKTTVGNVSGMSWELLDASTSKSLSNNIATISGSGTSASVTTKATGNANGQKITVQATVSINGYTYTGKKDITLSAATASFTMSGGSGSSIKATTIQSKAKAAVGNSSNVGFSYVKFDTPRNCTLTKSSSSSTAIGSTACYFSTTSGQKLSDVYVKLSGNATSGSVVYTVYDTNDNAVVTGTITFDSTAGEGSITCLGVEFDDADVVEMIEEEFANASGDVEYVKFDALASKYGRLLVGYKGIVEIDKAKDVKDTDKFYLKNSSSVDGVEDLYLLPRTDYYGTIEIGYTAYSSSNKSLGEGKLTFTVVRKTSSSKFTDVTASNVGSWAADAIDFMAGNGLVGGTGNNKFSPTGTMTRGDLVLIMYRMAGEPSVTGVENPFTDVKTADYYYKAILWAYKNGVVNGTGNGTTFSPKSNITREQIAAILYRYSGTTTATGSIASFTDAAKVSDYAVTALKWAVGAGIIGGSNNKLNPQGNATRAEVAVMLHRFLNK